MGKERFHSLLRTVWIPAAESFQDSFVGLDHKIVIDWLPVEPQCQLFRHGAEGVHHHRVDDVVAGRGDGMVESFIGLCLFFRGRTIFLAVDDEAQLSQILLGTHLGLRTMTL